MTITTSTKTIAHKVGITTAAVNAAARDLGIEMTYNPALRSWRIDSKTATALVEHLTSI